jgi:hypothetical protein
VPRGREFLKTSLEDVVRCIAIPVMKNPAHAGPASVGALKGDVDFTARTAPFAAWEEPVDRDD